MSTYPSIAAGQRITASLLTSMLPVFAYKTADESVTSSTALQNDDELFASLPANSTWSMTSYIQTNGANTGTGDIKIDFSVPAGATLKYTSFGTTTSSPAIQYEATVNSAGTARAVGTNGASPDMGMAMQALVTIGSTAGTVQFRWAQNTSTATATIVRAGSHLKFTRMA